MKIINISAVIISIDYKKRIICLITKDNNFSDSFYILFNTKQLHIFVYIYIYIYIYTLKA